MGRSRDKGILRDKAVYSRVTGLEELEFLQARYARQYFSPHSHEGYAIGVILGGLERFRYAGVEHLAGPGDVIAMNPEIVHTGEPGHQGGWTYKMIYLPPDFIQKALSGTDDQDLPIFQGPVLRDRWLACTLATLSDRCRCADNKLERDSVMSYALGHLVERHTRTHGTEKSYSVTKMQLANVRDRLEGIADGDEDDPSLIELAQFAELSPMQLLRKYSSAYGMSPHAHLRNMRLLRAKHFLKLGETPAMAAMLSGFTDQSHLTKWFKRVVGVTPAAYAKGANIIA